MSQELLARHSDERRLAAILAGEIAPYARLVGHDAAQTPRDLDAHEDVVLLIIQICGSIIERRALCRMRATSRTPRTLKSLNKCASLTDFSYAAQREGAT